MCVTDLPSGMIGDFLALWGLGLMFGGTMEVDMAFTRRTFALIAYTPLISAGFDIA
jgi:hypothetical protein